MNHNRCLIIFIQIQGRYSHADFEDIYPLASKPVPTAETGQHPWSTMSASNRTGSQESQIENGSNQRSNGSNGLKRTFEQANQKVIVEKRMPLNGSNRLNENNQVTNENGQEHTGQINNDFFKWFMNQVRFQNVLIHVSIHITLPFRSTN